MKPYNEVLLKSVNLKAKNENLNQHGFKIEVLDAGEQASMPCRLNFFEILYIKEGRGNLLVDERKHVLNNNTFLCLAVGQYRSIELSEDASGYRVSLSPEFFLLNSDWENDYTMEWEVPSTGELDDLITRMIHEYQFQDDNKSIEIVQSLLKVFLIYLQRKSERKDNQLHAAHKDRLLVHRFFRLLQKFHVSKKLVADYADELCITPNYLNSVVKRQTGYPASHHIQQFIITEAKRQAIYSGLRMKEVANMLGFEDYAHFSKFFKNYSGVNFSDYKRSVLV